MGSLGGFRCQRCRAEDPVGSPTNALSWPDIREWPRREALLDAEEARLLGLVPLPKREGAGKGRA